MKKKKKSIPNLIKILILIIAILLVLVAYAFIVKPVINGMVVNAYNEGIQSAITEVFKRAAACQQVPLIVGNKTRIVIDLSCMQIQ